MPVYFIGEHESGCTIIKIGRTVNVPNRLRNLQTGNSSLLKLMGWLTPENDAAVESELHQHFAKHRLRGEWFSIEAADILPILMRAGVDGFVCKNADAFQIVGHDRDAVPEYLGVWEWGDLEYYECCPFCGCCCGMSFQEASQMYHCIHCGRLTDFSELSPHHEDENF